MILLTTITDLIQVVTAQAVAVDVHASYVDHTASTNTPDRKNTKIVTAATTSVVLSPAASTQRNVKYISVSNIGASPVTVSIQHTDGTTTVNLFPPVSLLAGYTIEYLDGSGFTMFSNAGVILSAGATGAAGATGSIGPPGWHANDDYSPDDFIPPGISDGYMTRTKLAADAKNWTFLGSATGATVTVGPIAWPGIYRNFYFEYVIAGYNGGTPVGRILVGGAAISTTGATNGNSLMSDVTVNNTSVSVPGLPLAVTLTPIARSGCGFVYGASGSFKQIVATGMNGNPAAATSPTQFSGCSFFTDLGTNLPLQRAQLTVYDTLIATAVSVQTFLAGTYLSIWGRNND